MVKGENRGKNGKRGELENGTKEKGGKRSPDRRSLQLQEIVFKIFLSIGIKTTMIIESKVEFSSPKYSNRQKHNKQIKTKVWQNTSSWCLHWK